MEAFQPGRMLSPSDIVVDSREDPQCITVFLRHSKTDPFGAGSRIYLGRTGDPTCPVSALLAYLALRPSTPGPLFLFQDGSCLSRQRLVTHLREALVAAGVDTAGYSGHSFRIGAASTAARAGLSEPLVKMLGRWKSSAYLTYVRSHPDSLLVSSVLAHS